MQVHIETSTNFILWRYALHICFRPLKFREWGFSRKHYPSLKDRGINECPNWHTQYHIGPFYIVVSYWGSGPAHT